MSLKVVNFGFSRWAEDLIIYSTSEFGYVLLADAYWYVSKKDVKSLSNNYIYFCTKLIRQKVLSQYVVGMRYTR